MSKYPIQRFTSLITLPTGANRVDAPVVGADDTFPQLNGRLKGVTVLSPEIDGSSFSIIVLGQRGETLFTKASLSAGGLQHFAVNDDGIPLSIPVALVGVSPIRIAAAGLDPSEFTLNWASDATITDGETITIGGVVYTFKNSIAVANDIKIEVDPDDTLTNLADAINHEDGGGEEGTTYGTGTVANPYCTAGAVTSHTLTLESTSIVATGTDVEVTTDAAEITLSGETFEGGGESEDREFEVDLLIDRG